MLKSQIPAKLPVPFAVGNPALTTTIPATTGVPGRASFLNGFTGTNMEPEESGGIPPFGPDFNGLFNAIYNWLQWLNLGAPVAFDNSFAEALTVLVGGTAEVQPGYPQGAVVSATSTNGWWLSLVDNNTVNPDSGPSSQWMLIPITQVYAGNPNGNLAGQTATSTSPAEQVWDSTNGVIWVCTFTGPATGGTGVQAVWAPLANLNPVQNIAGASRNYVAADNGSVFVRSNSGGAMAEAMPSVAANGWHVTIRNGDTVGGVLTISVPAGASLNGTLNGTQLLLPGQSTEITRDANGNYILTVPPIPVVFSGQAIYVNSSGPITPGVYDVDTSQGAITLTLTAGPQQGDNYVFNDITGSFGRFNCNVNLNGATIAGRSENLVLDQPWIEECRITATAGTPANWELV